MRCYHVTNKTNRFITTVNIAISIIIVVIISSSIKTFIVALVFLDDVILIYIAD